MSPCADSDVQHANHRAPCRNIVERAGGATVRQVAAVADGIAREVLAVQLAPAA
jgi:hypothetical protein